MTRIVRAVAALAALAAVQLSTVPAAAEDVLDRALSLAFEGRHADARRLLAPLLESESGDPQVRLLHGFLELQEGRRSEAIAVFSGLAREYPDLFEAHNNLAVAYVQEGRLEEARAVLAEVLERHPDAIGYRNLGDIYMQLARRALALGRALGGGDTEDRDDGETPGGGFLHASEAAPSASGTAATAIANSVAEPAAASERPVQAVAALTPVCVVTTEFSDMDAAEEARQWLDERGPEPARVARGSRKSVKNYRVYLPPLDSRSGARVRMRELQEKGVSDIAVVLRGELNNAVSLGVYASEANARRRKAQLEDLGYTPVQEPNARTVAEYATIEASLSGSYDDLNDAWASRFPDQTLRQVDCD